MFLLNGNRINLDRAFTGPDGVQYPDNWLRLTTPEERATIGIIEVDEPTRPDGQFYVVTQNADYSYNAVEKPIADLRSIFASMIAMNRYTHETGGTTINGMPVATDRASQAIFTGASVRAMRNPDYSVNWKTAAGFVLLDNATILAVADAVGGFVQACFDHEASLIAQVDSAKSLADLQAIDIQTGWPK